MRYLALFAAANSLVLRTVMMNESHRGAVSVGRRGDRFARGLSSAAPSVRRLGCQCSVGSFQRSVVSGPTTDYGLRRLGTESRIQMNEDEAQRNRGVDPAAAASDLRAILAAGGEGEGVIAQCRALDQWAKRTRRFLAPTSVVAEARIGGLEHRVWSDEQHGVVRKVTYGGSFGRTVRSVLRGLVPATPLEYLDRWTRHNELFGNITRISGVTMLAGDGLVILTEQDALYGQFPPVQSVEGFMQAMGFSAQRQLAFTWYDPARDLAVFDARPGNFILVEDTAVPFDVIPVPLSEVVDWPNGYDGDGRRGG